MAGTIYHSGHFLVLAARAYERSLSFETEAEVAIILSAAAIEGFLNEITDSVRHHIDSKRIRAFREILVEAEKSHLQPLLKIQLAVFALQGAVPSRGDSWIQEVDALFSLRDDLIHVKPIPVHDLPSDTKPPAAKASKAINHLASRKKLVIPKSGEFAWRQLVSKPEVARWAYNTAVNTRRSIAGAVPRRSQFSKIIRFRLQNEKPLPEPRPN